MILETRALQFEYDERNKFEFPDIELRPGGKLLIMGRSGVGKSTLLNLLSGVLRPSSGEIWLLEDSYAELSTRRLDVLRANQVGIIFQSLNLIPYLTGYQNACLGIQFSPQRQAKLIDRDLEIRRLATALGFQHFELDRPVDKLSVGQQQRIASIRALLGEPSLILADEPTSALDSKSTKKFLNELTDSLNSSRQALVMVSHDRALLPYFDQVIELDDPYDG